MSKPYSLIKIPIINNGRAKIDIVSHFRVNLAMATGDNYGRIVLTQTDILNINVIGQVWGFLSIMINEEINNTKLSSII